jgi:uncharacterized protein YjbI with pentapeptide repeats
MGQERECGTFLVEACIIEQSHKATWAREGGQMQIWQRVKLPLLGAATVFLVFLLAWYAPFTHERLGLAGDPPPASAPLSGVVIVRSPTTVLDLIQLLLLPLVVFLGGLWFNREENNRAHELQRQREAEVQRLQQSQEKEAQKLADARAQDTPLQAYLDQMTQLLLDKRLRTSQEGDEVRSIARARTLMVLRVLDETRKATVVQFLYEARLVSYSQTTVRLDGVDLRKARLRGADLTGVRLRGADLREAHLEAVQLLMADLREADFQGAKLEVANLLKADLREADLQGADLQGAKLQGADLQGTKLQGAKLQGVDLRGAILIRANLEGADLTGADLQGADLTGVNLQGVDLTEAILIWVNLEGMNLMGAILIRANLEGADLTGADLSGADLSGANLSGANIVEANLSGANLSGANLSGANLIRANLLSTNITPFQRDQAEVYVGAKLPPELEAVLEEIGTKSAASEAAYSTEQPRKE